MKLRVLWFIHVYSTHSTNQPFYLQPPTSRESPTLVVRLEGSRSGCGRGPPRVSSTRPPPAKGFEWSYKGPRTAISDTAEIAFWTKDQTVEWGVIIPPKLPVWVLLTYFATSLLSSYTCSCPVLAMFQGCRGLICCLVTFVSSIYFRW